MMNQDYERSPVLNRKFFVTLALLSRGSYNPPGRKIWKIYQLNPTSKPLPLSRPKRVHLVWFWM